MPLFRSLIVDDESAARSRMIRLLVDHKETEIVGQTAIGMSVSGRPASIMEAAA